MVKGVSSDFNRINRDSISPCAKFGHSYGNAQEFRETG
jgi:hypothetical protein